MLALADTQARRTPRFNGTLLDAVLARGRAASPALADRMDRAAELVQWGRIVALSATSWEIRSEREPHRPYRLTPEGCTCANTAPCEHRLAVALLFVCEQETARRERLN